MAVAQSFFARSLVRLGVALLQFILITILPPLIFVGPDVYGSILPWDAIFNSMLVNVLGLSLSIIIQQRFEDHPQKHPAAYIVPITLSVYTLLLSVVFLLHAPYAVKFIVMGVVMTIPFLATLHVIKRNHKQKRFLAIPLGETLNLKNSDHYKFKRLTKPVLPKAYIDGVVADLHSGVLTAEWERFLAHCALKRIPIYNVMQLNETITGMVSIKHLSKNDFGVLAPSMLRMNIKQLFDILFILMVSPVILPLTLLIALWIRLDSPGGALYIQERVGFNGRLFRVFKFRSMVVDHGGSDFTEADESHRITKVGKLIRKYRLDELPQFWNILRGEMSLIGPRPESLALARWYELEVPFFQYRHVVRPGISGWAQVKQGYAAGVDEMRGKVAYDFYYIKHFSAWLDMLIWYKTIKTVFTGFGSR